jgi:hypothetical protein
MAAAGPAAEEPAAGYTLLRELRPSVLRGVPVVAARFRPGANQLLVLGHGNVLRTLDLTTYGALRGFANAACAGSRVDACFSPDGRYVAAGSEAGVLSMWEADSGTAVPARARVEGGRRAVIGYPAPLYGVAWNPLRHLLAVCSFGSALPVMLVGRVAQHAAAAAGLAGK